MLYFYNVSILIGLWRYFLIYLLNTATGCGGCAENAGPENAGPENAGPNRRA